MIQKTAVVLAVQVLILGCQCSSSPPFGADSASATAGHRVRRTKVDQAVVVVGLHNELQEQPDPINDGNDGTRHEYVREQELALPSPTLRC